MQVKNPSPKFINLLKEITNILLYEINNKTNESNSRGFHVVIKKKDKSNSFHMMIKWKIKVMDIFIKVIYCLHEALHCSIKTIFKYSILFFCKARRGNPNPP